MKNITITDENFMHIASRIKKFMDGRNIIIWHNFDCSMKRHIQGDFYLCPGDSTKVRPVYRYNRVKCKIYTPETNHRFSEKFINIRLDEDHGGTIRVGDVVRFVGNRIHVKEKYFGNHKFIYTVYQIWDPNGGFGYLKHYPPCDYGILRENDY